MCGCGRNDGIDGIEKHRVTASRQFGGASGERRGLSLGTGLEGGAEANEEEEALEVVHRRHEYGGKPRQQSGRIW